MGYKEQCGGEVEQQHYCYDQVVVEGGIVAEERHKRLVLGCAGPPSRLGKKGHVCLGEYNTAMSNA